MKIKGFIKGLLVALLMTSSAHAVTLQNNHAYALSGNIRGSDGVLYSLTTGGLSYFTLSNNVVNAVLNLMSSTGVVAQIKLTNLTLSSLGNGNFDMNAPAGVTVFSGGYKDVGDFTKGASFSNVATAMPGKIYSNTNDFKIWVKYFSQAGVFQYGQTDFHLKIGSDVTSQVPEPMTMSLLGMGLLGGAISRKKRATA